jgi:hypothetical protein
LHAALGIAKGSQTTLPFFHQQHIVGELVVQKAGSVCAGNADDAKVGQGGNALHGNF